MKLNLLVPSVAVLCCLMGLSACQDENDNIPATPYPYTLLEMNEEITTDDLPVSISQTYLYDRYTGNITSYRIQQTVKSREGDEVLYASDSRQSIVYGEQSVCITDEEGNRLDYTLHASGYAIRCLRTDANGNKRKYEFEYFSASNGHRYLQQVTEVPEGDTRPYATIEIAYDDLLAPRIAQCIDENRINFRLTLSDSPGIPNTTGQPCLFLTELYPLSVHHVALYGRLLGDAYATLETAVIPDDESLTRTESVAYDYATDAEQVPVSCHITTITPSRQYRRTITYRWE